jgi:membrane-bound metal-dependent hydrolase YbcI (DUF457 family)
MANFKAHITTSSVLGAGYGAAMHLWWGATPDQALLAAGLCGLSGMLPDLDSDNSVPLRESLAFGAAFVPMLLIDRFRHLGFTTDMMVLAGAAVYLLIRFGLAAFLRNYTVHRGMFHSVPAALICAELTFLICDCDDLRIRFFKAGAVLLGFLSHLLLDELNSIELRFPWPRLKKSFGTALKLYSRSLWANVSTYAKLALLTWVLLHDSVWDPYASGAHDPAHLVHGDRPTSAGSGSHATQGSPADDAPSDSAASDWWQRLWR